MIRLAPLQSAAVTKASNVGQGEVRRWWTQNPMTYDWTGTIPHDPGSPEYLAEVERRFLAECWFAQPRGAPPFSGLIDFASLPDKDVLEIGCGTGVHSRLLAESGARLTAIDLTPTAIDFTTRRLALHDLEATVREADAEHLPFADASFDFVWSWGVVHHSADTRQVLSEIARVLRPGGRLSLMVYHRSSITYWAQYQLIRGVLGGQLLRSSPAEIANRYSDGVVARHFTRDELRGELSPWFDVDRVEVMGQIGESVPLPGRLRRPIEGFLPQEPRRALLRRYGWFVFASGTKRYVP
jgi:SAM-dependent methyltransferase